MKQQKHCEMGSSNPRDKSSCTGTVKRNGWTTVSIDGSTWLCPSWVCSECGMQWWSYFDTDNGDEGYDMEDPLEDEE